MDKLFEPCSIVVVGASAHPGKIGYEVLKNVSRCKGRVYAVNPKSDMILGVKCYKNIDEIPDSIDLAVFVVSSNVVPTYMEECGKKGVKYVVIISGGFKEMGSDKFTCFEQKTVDIAKKYGIRVIGPNCIGIYNPKSKLDTFFQPVRAMDRPQEGDIAFLTQSGTYGCSFLEWVREESIGISKFVSYGNKCDIDEIDMLTYLENDKDTKVIAMYIEDISDGKRFLSTAKKVCRKKPIVILKAGLSENGARAAKSHTGALASNTAVFVGASAQSGIILVDDLDEMLDVVKILSMQPLPQGNRIGMTTNGVGPCVVAIDSIENSNVKLSKLAVQSVQKLTARLPEYCIISNPIDLTGSADASMYKIALDVLGEDPNVDIILPFFVFQDAPLASTVEDLHKTMEETQKYGKTLVGVASGGEFTKRQVRRLQERGIPVIPTPRRAICALSKVAKYSQWLTTA